MHNTSVLTNTTVDHVNCYLCNQKVETKHLLKQISMHTLLRMKPTVLSYKELDEQFIERWIGTIEPSSTKDNENDAMVW